MFSVLQAFPKLQVILQSVKITSIFWSSFQLYQAYLMFIQQ